MAGRASCSSSSSFSYGWKYDVFLSFRGEDNRFDFVGYLYKALNDKGFNTFFDDKELQGGDEITSSLRKAIKESRIVIPIFTQNYASSSFCLDELVDIIGCNKAEGRLVLPVFYKVDPSDVLYQRGSYGEALAKHEERFSKDDKEKLEDNMERLKKWKMALKEAANLSGEHFKLGNEKYEYEFIGKIVKVVSNKTNRALLHVADYPEGLESRVLEVNSLLDVGSDDVVHMVGIHGIGGIGKTTLARAVYNSIADSFHGSCFLGSVRENSMKYGLVHLQEMLLSKVVGEKDIKLGDICEGISIIKHRLHRKKVLLILDDVDDLKQLQAMVGGPDWFGPGSRVIITTRDKHLLASHGVERTYEVQSFADSVKKPGSVGPYGGNGGSHWDDGTYSGVRQLVIVHGAGIDSIQIEYDSKGCSIWSEKHGGIGGGKTDKVKLDYPDEFLTSIHGYHDSLLVQMGPNLFMVPNMVRSVSFESNKKTYGPFGVEQGTYFSVPMTGAKMVGFHGRCGWYLDAIGVYMKSLKQPNASKTLAYSQNYITNTTDNVGFSEIQGSVGQNYDIVIPVETPSKEIIPRETSIAEIDSAQWPTKLVLAKPAAAEVSCGVIKEPAPCGPGPWGGDGGRPWDDGVFSGIKQIYLTTVPEGICSIQIEYDRNRQSVWSVKHGGNGGGGGGDTMHRIKLEYPHEVLTCISGYYGSITKDEQHIIIKSLTFYTSRGQYGPYGEEVGKFFTSTTTEGKVVGFHGSSSMYLDAIGVHMQH